MADDGMDLKAKTIIKHQRARIKHLEKRLLEEQSKDGLLRNRFNAKRGKRMVSKPTPNGKSMTSMFLKHI